MSDSGKVAPAQQPEPWLRGTLTDVPPVARAVLHALELAKEDVHRWCGPLTDADFDARPLELPSLAFHLRHIVRSCDRLLTYAEGNQLSGEQIAVLKTEMDAGAGREALFAEFEKGLEDAVNRVRVLGAGDLSQPRFVGKKQLPTTVGGLLVHVADHTQRHVGQAVTTAKILLAQKA
ncbi:MAG TPA: DinB family protein [Pseudacidobacterium sp.]|nr:DinB family protein [Pseudacidobacterium sp.]